MLELLCKQCYNISEWYYSAYKAYTINFCRKQYKIITYLKTPFTDIQKGKLKKWNHLQKYGIRCSSTAKV